MATRTRSAQDGVTSFGPFQLLASERRLLRDGASVEIGSRSLDILIALVEHAGEVVGKKELVARVWPDVIVEESSLRVHVAGLRRALEDGRDGARYVANIPGRGYSFVAPVIRTSIAQQASQSRTGAEVCSLERRSRLPPRLARMVGRDDEVAAVRNELLLERFVSVVGPGGMGKTTVAVAVAHALAPEFPDSVVFVDFVAIEAASLVADTVASALGLALQANDPVSGLLAFLESRRLLLILDNCEHVIAPAAALAERIYLTAPQVYILATSREPLRVEGEHIHPLLPLESPDETSSLTAAQALAFPAVQLFMERAGAAGNRESLTDADARTVATICCRLDGIALALELAAGRVAAHGICGTAQMLDLRFRLLWQGRRTALPRHQTLSALLDWSYNLLAEEERRVLRRLSVFVGTFSLQDAQAIAGDAGTDPGYVAEGMTNLVAKSLLSTPLRDGQPRYKLLEVTREYASSKLDASGESESTARRHAVYFSQLEVDLSAAPVHVDYLGNMRAALAWCFSRATEYDIGRDLAVRVAPILIRLSLLAECHRWSEQALATLAQPERGTAGELDLLAALAICAMFTRGNDADVGATIERALRLAQALGNRTRELQLLAGVNIFRTRVGDFAGALRAAEQGATIARSLADPAGVVIADWMLAVGHHLIGDQRAALMYCENGLGRGGALHSIPPQFFAYDHRIRALVTQARALWLKGAVDKAASVGRRAVDEAAALGQPVSICISLIYTATVYLWRGDWLAADDVVTKGLDESKRYSLGPYHSVCLGQKGELLLRQGDAASAIDLLRRAFYALTSERHFVLAPACGAVLAEGLAATGQCEEAVTILEQAIAQRDSSGASFDLPEMLRIKACILGAQSRSRKDEAMACLARAMDLARSQSALSWELRIAVAWVQLQPAGSDARERLRAIRARFTEGFATADLVLADQLLGSQGSPE